MRKTLLFAAVLSLALATWLATAPAADAATYEHWRPYTPTISTPAVSHTRHMPGWDWRRTYPWSPYNYGRNPYNPIVVPYPYPYVDPYPVYTPLPPVVSTPLPAQLSLPYVVAPTSYPPPGTALIEVSVPTTTAQVTFDGHPSYTTGTFRYFVTPTLNAEQTYDVGATWTQFGQPVQQHRVIHVLPGQTRVVTFPR